MYNDFILKLEWFSGDYMKFSSCGDNTKIINDNSKSPLFTICGNIKTEYIENEKIYIISRTDGKAFDGTEYLDIAYSKQKIEGIAAIVEHEINIFTLYQNNIESIMFNKFYYRFSDSLKYIIIEPIFEHTDGVEAYFPLENSQELRLSRYKKGIIKIVHWITERSAF